MFKSQQSSIIVKWATITIINYITNYIYESKDRNESVNDNKVIIVRNFHHNSKSKYLTVHESYQHSTNVGNIYTQ